MSEAYKKAGVDVEAGYRSNELIKASIQKTMRKEVLSDIGGFGGLFSLAAAKSMKDPVLVSGTDGVGTKLKIAFLTDEHSTVGIDCVAMCVNDIVCAGAEPLFFLDYLACGKNFPEKIASIVSGVAKGCEWAGCALIGGETAEMPGFYPEDEYDLAGFAVGMVDREKMISGKDIKEGNFLIGISSSGLHSNGFSLVRSILKPSAGNINDFISQLGCTLGEELLRPTKIYVKAILELMKSVSVKGAANITGGGFIENIPRMMPEGIKAKIDKGAWDVLPVFHLLKDRGGLSERDMYNTFNMGIGMVLCVSPEEGEKTLSLLSGMGEKAWVIGRAVSGEGIEIC